MIRLFLAQDHQSQCPLPIWPAPFPPSRWCLSEFESLMRLVRDGAEGLAQNSMVAEIPLGLRPEYAIRFMTRVGVLVKGADDRCQGLGEKLV
jgi:hypothetical protein